MRAYAKHRGVSVESVSQAVKLGRISTIGKGNNRKIDPEKADKEWTENTKVNYQTTQPSAPKEDEPKPPTEADKSNQMYNRSRAIKEAYSAKLAAAEYQEKIGKLVSAEKVKNDSFRIARIVRDKILNIPDRIAHEVAAESDAHKVTIILIKALNEALEEMTSDGNQHKTE